MADGARIEVDVKDVTGALDRIMGKNIRLYRGMRKLIRSALMEGKRYVVAGARGAIPNDPRKAYRAVSVTTYREVFGGNINILTRYRRAGKPTTYVPVRKLRAGQRGGNRLTRSKDTERIDGYGGSDRGFILRFNNSGTTGRFTKVRGEWYRGSIRGRGWFEPSARTGLEHAQKVMLGYIEQITSELWDGKVYKNKQ